MMACPFFLRGVINPQGGKRIGLDVGELAQRLEGRTGGVAPSMPKKSMRNI
jgi:hypothetical protein